MRCFLVSAAILLLACGGDYHRGYLEDLLETELPRGTGNISHFTGSDLAFTSHYTLPSDSMDVFIQAAGFTTEPAVTWDSPLFLSGLPEPWNVLPEQGEFFYLTGSSGWNSWDCILNTVTGDLWVTVFYTDASGDPPGP